jgi:hypothetical protein
MLENWKCIITDIVLFNPSIIDNNLKVRNDKKYGLSDPASEYQMGINS